MVHSLVTLKVSVTLFAFVVDERETLSFDVSSVTLLTLSVPTSLCPCPVSWKELPGGPAYTQCGGGRNSQWHSLERMAAPLTVCSSSQKSSSTELSSPHFIKGVLFFSFQF